MNEEQATSTLSHRVDVIRAHLDPHPGADALDVIKVFGYTCCVRRGDFAEGDLVAYIPPDSVVDSGRPEFAFLLGHERIKVRKLRGMYSQGLIVHAPAGAHEGDDVADVLGVKHYEPPLEMKTQWDDAPQPFHTPVYDVENWRRYRDLFIPGEQVEVTEKINGCNARYVWHDGKLHCGSRNHWKKDGSIWHLGAAHEPWLLSYCAEVFPGTVFYGELFGGVKGFTYGQTKNSGHRVVLFDAWSPADGWVPERVPEAAKPPIVFRGPYDAGAIEGLSLGPTMMHMSAKGAVPHIREGVVVRAVPERYDVATQMRALLKVVSNDYLAK